MTLHPADQLAFDNAMVTQPVWNRFNSVQEVASISDNTLLHAGPAFKSVSEITKPILHSACVAAVYEGLVGNFDQAEVMINNGEILLQPAQDHNIVVPLAAVISGSMPLHCVYDAWGGTHRTYAPINGGARPSLRLGLRSEQVLEHIRWLNTRLLDVLQAGLAEGIALVPIAVSGLLGGDDCHGRTPVAGAKLVSEIIERTSGEIESDALEFMHSSPSLFLNLWMAATKCMMLAASDVEDSSFVTSAGGNGREVGIQISGLPGRWFTTEAEAPKGSFDIDLPPDRALGAIGDSAVVDAFGLGAMTVEATPDHRSVVNKYYPPDGPSRISELSVGSHPYFHQLNLQLGSTARSAAESGKGPMISLGIVDKNGEAGRLGGGIYDMPVAPFTQAMTALRQSGKS